MSGKQKPKILVTAEMAHLPESRDILEKNVQATYAPLLSYAELLRAIPSYDAILTNLRQKIDREVIDAGRKLKLIATPSTGTDHIDVPYAENRGITVQSLKHDYDVLKTITSTAEHAFLLMLACLRKLPFAFDAVKSGKWNSSDWRGREAAGRVVGIIGYGRLGEIFSRLAHGFAMKVIACDPFKKIRDPWVRQVPMKELLGRSEIITIHVHLTPETRGMIGAREFALMRNGVYLVNTSRGALLDEHAFLRALKSGKIACAGIDVLAHELDGHTANEPLVQYARTHHNLIITPHVGGCSYDAQEKALRHASLKLTTFLESKKTFIPPAITRYTPAEITKLKPLYESILLGVLDAILDRYERDPGYHFIDTKLSVITGRDFDDLNEKERKIRGKNVVYSWIQGRGLEALARHAEWLKSCARLSASGKTIRIKRIKKMLREVTAEMESVRRRNGGKLYFCFNRAGQALESVNFRDLVPLRREIPPGSNLSDLFYAKGLLAAAACLGDSALAKKAMPYLKGILSDIEEKKFYNDQQPFDPKNRVRHVPGQYRQAQWMIGVSALALAGELTGENWCFEAGERFIRHVLQSHLNLGQLPQLEKYDYFELADAKDRPWVEDGKILSDPGHAAEFAGLAGKLLGLMKNKRQYAKLLAECRKIFPEMLIHSFQLGFNAKAGGICKTIDLVSRRPFNTDLPWWSLPETMRAGMELLALDVDKKYHRRILKIIAVCSNSFLKYYVNPDVSFMAYQTRNARGRVIDVIPATPDADPGYHTGLSIIDFLDKLKPPELTRKFQQQVFVDEICGLGHSVMKSSPS